jgi:hypothetical protein
MIKFFRNIRQKLVAEGKTTNYIKYAIGEIVLVVIGILIALQVNNWNENRKNIQVATTLKSRLINDFNADIDEIKKRIEFFDKIINFGYSVEAELTHHKASNLDEKWQFIVNVFHVSQVWNVTPTNTTYNEIQNSNLLGYIGPSELSNNLYIYYINSPIQLDQINGGTIAYRDYSRSIIPMHIQAYIWKNCYDSTVMGTQNIIACNLPDINHNVIETLYQSIVSDPDFKKLLTRRLSTIYVRNSLHNSEIRLANSIINQIKSLN